MTLDTSTKPIPVITALPRESSTAPITSASPRSGLRLGIGAGVGIAVVALLALNWHLVIGALTTLALMSAAGFFVLCVLFRIITGGRLGSAAVGAVVTALILRRRR